MKNLIQKRLAFEIGSGSIKYQLANVDTTNQKVLKNFNSGKQQFLFLNNLKQNQGNIDSTIVQESLEYLKKLNGLQNDQMAGIATEAFRQAQNGQEVIQNMQDSLGCSIQVVGQEKEAQYGFRSALAECDIQQDKLISWDCGAGSFQMANSKDQVHVDSFGSGTVYKMAFDIQQRGYKQQLQPLTQSMITEMENKLHKKMKSFPDWVKKQENSFVGVGSEQSIFNQQCLLLGKEQFSYQEVQKVLENVSGLDYQELYQYEKEMQKISNQSDYIVKEENSKYIIPKLVLLKKSMELAEIEKMQFKQTFGNCSAILTDNNLWEKQKLLTLNWHLEKDCNYKCSFCYAHFAHVKEHVPLEEGKQLLEMAKNSGFYKVNFAGGEPLLNKNLAPYLEHARKVGLKTSIITNASRMTKKFLKENAVNIDQIGVSCDSLDDVLQKKLGRGFGQHVDITKRAIKRVQEINQQQNLDIKVKLNTVVLRENHMEDWNNFILENNVQRWKIFKILKIEGENSDNYDNLSIEQEQFDAFVERHQKLTEHGVQLAFENNEDMTQSYLMLTPDGKMYQNSEEGVYKYSDYVIKQGFISAMEQLGFLYDRFQKRGGEYTI